MRDSFIGRSQPLQDLESLVCNTPLLTVSGPGGVGKTRLVLEWMKAGENAKSGRRILVRLDGLNECSAVFGAVAAAVGLPNTGGQPYVDAIVQWLRETRLCLVLDNCEHVADPVAILVRALLSGTQGVRVVATSRTPLGIAGERHLRLLPLNEAEAQDLFLARCRERVHGVIHGSLADGKLLI